jgi:hypothetical protein
VLGVAVLAAAGCASVKRSTPQALHLQRADLIAVSRALRALEPSVRSEVRATKAAWPLVANGLPANLSALPRAPIATAGQRAAAIELPELFAERTARSLTGPGAHLAGLLRSYSVLSTRGWALIGAAIHQIQHGSATAARFARANVALYIQSVYDAHFGLAQIGKQLLAAYDKLGSASAFGASLTPAEVNALARTYSEANDRLHPHTGVHLGS